MYSAHEYTESNAKFAVFVNPHNEALKQRQQQVQDLRLKVGAIRGYPIFSRLPLSRKNGIRGAILIVICARVCSPNELMLERAAHEIIPSPFLDRTMYSLSSSCVAAASTCCARAVWCGGRAQYLAPRHPSRHDAVVAWTGASNATQHDEDRAGYESIPPPRRPRYPCYSQCVIRSKIVQISSHGIIHDRSSMAIPRPSIMMAGCCVESIFIDCGSLVSAESGEERALKV